MRLLSSKASRRVSWVCFDDKIGACFGESCLDYQVHSFVGHRTWISPFACLVRLFPDQSTDFRPDAAVGTPFLPHIPPPNGFAGCDWLCTQLPVLFAGIKRLSLSSLDGSIGHIT
jgi:hypothetical protein